MKLLYLAKNNIEAEIIKDKLLQLNINSFFLDSNLHMAVGELPLEALYVKIFVEEKEYKDAKKFIEQYKIVLSKSEQDELWCCANCDAESPKSINVCWQCGSESLI